MEDAAGYSIPYQCLNPSRHPLRPSRLAVVYVFNFSLAFLHVAWNNLTDRRVIPMEIAMRQLSESSKFASRGAAQSHLALGRGVAHVRAYTRI